MNSEHPDINRYKKVTQTIQEHVEIFQTLPQIQRLNDTQLVEEQLSAD